MLLTPDLAANPRPCQLAAYPPTSGAVTAIAVYRATPPAGLGHGQVWQVRMFERHAFTTQAFIPMAKGEWGAGVGESAMARTEGEGGMLVIVALNGPGQSLLFRLGLLFGDRDGD
jgi:ureidoglycolate hydrolase